MHHFFIQAKQVNKTTIIITGSDVNHIKNVLRMQPSEQLSVTDEDGVEYLCEITGLDNEEVRLNILEKKEDNHELPAKIYLYQGLPKGDKMEMVIQKAVELGIYEIIPVETRRCVVKLDSKKKVSKGKRWNAIAESAAKQSKRAVIPKVAAVMRFEDALASVTDFDAVCIPYEQAKGMEQTKQFLQKLTPGIKAAFFIGPEGGFEEEEIRLAVRHGILPVSLGKRVLRAETASIALLSMMMLELECQMA